MFKKLVVMLAVVLVGSFYFSMIAKACYECESENYLDSYAPSYSSGYVTATARMLINGNYYSVDEYIDMLNAGMRFALNIETGELTSIDSSMIPFLFIDPFNWLWTDCTHFAGHNWTVWSSWFVGSVFHHPSCVPGNSPVMCDQISNRTRNCQRNNCPAQDRETMRALLWC